MKLKSIYSVISLFLISVTVTILLTSAKHFLLNKENSQKYGNITGSCMAVMPEAGTFEENNGIYIAKNSAGNILGYIFITEARGYADTISVMTGITKEGSISGIEILSLSETPGVGMKVSEQWFKDRFITDYIPDKFEVIKESVNGRQNKVEAITGATISSVAVTEAVNDAINLFKEYEQSEVK